MSKDAATLPKFILLIFLPYSPKGPIAFYWVTMHWGKRNKETFRDYWTLALNLRFFQETQNVTVVLYTEPRLIEVKF